MSEAIILLLAGRIFTLFFDCVAKCRIIERAKLHGSMRDDDSAFFFYAGDSFCAFSESLVVLSQQQKVGQVSSFSYNFNSTVRQKNNELKATVAAPRGSDISGTQFDQLRS